MHYKKAVQVSLKALFTLSSLVVLLYCFGSNTSAQKEVAAQSLLLVLNKAENTLSIIDSGSLKELAKVPTGEGPHEVVASGDGKLAFVANYGTQQVVGSSISIIDLATKKEIKKIDLGALRRPHGIVEIGGKVYFSCEVNRAIARYDIKTDKIDWLMGTGQNATHMIVVTADQKRIFTANIASDSVTAFEFNAAPPAPSKVAHISVGKQPEAIDISPDGKEVWVGHRNEGKLTIIDTEANKVKEVITTGQDPYRLRFTPDGRRVFVTDPGKGELIVIDAATRKEIKRIQLEDAGVGITFSPDSRRAFVSTAQKGQVAVINLEDFSITTRITVGKGPDGIAWAGK